MRKRSASIALIRRIRVRQMEYLFQWNNDLNRLHFIGGERGQQESFHECVMRSTRAALKLQSADGLKMASHAVAHLRFDAPSESTGELTAYDIAVYEGTLTDQSTNDHVNANPDNCWIDGGGILAGRSADGRRVSETMRLVLGKAGRLPRWSRNSDALIVGVTGHRRLPSDAKPDIVAKVEKVFDDLAEEFPDRPVRLLTSLAEGGERWVTDVAVLRRFEIHAAFPCPIVEYEDEFTDAESVAEFRWMRDRTAQWFCFSGNGHATGTTADRYQQHETVGRYIVDQSDVLIALWDGRPAARAGSTAQTVLYALAEQRHRSQYPLLRHVRTPRQAGSG